MAATGPRDDVVVIGGGITGVTAAYYLARSGSRVRLVDKATVASHQSGRNWGFTRRQGCDPTEVALAQHASQCWDELGAEVGAELTLVKRGLINLAATESELAKYRQWLADSAGAQIFGSTLVTPEEVRTLLPAIAGDWAGGLYTAGDGHAEPAKATAAIGEAAEQAGATLELHTTVLGLHQSGGRVIGVRTTAGDRFADTVICAAGAWSSRLLRPLGVRLPVRWIRASAGRTGPAPLVTDLAVSTPGVGFSQGADGAVTFGTAAWSDYDLNVETLANLRLFLPNFARNRKMIRLHVNGVLLDDIRRRLARRSPAHSAFHWPRVDDPTPNRAKVAGAHEALRRLVPKFADTTMTQVWAGTVDVTPDAMPVLGPVQGIDGLLLATGTSSHGFGIGPGVGQAVAELARTGTAPIDLAPFRLDRFHEASIRAHHHL